MRPFASNVDYASRILISFIRGGLFFPSSGRYASRTSVGEEPSGGVSHDIPRRLIRRNNHKGATGGRTDVSPLTPYSLNEKVAYMLYWHAEWLWREEAIPPREPRSFWYGIISFYPISTVRVNRCTWRIFGATWTRAIIRRDLFVLNGYCVCRPKWLNQSWL